MLDFRALWKESLHVPLADMLSRLGLSQEPDRSALQSIASSRPIPRRVIGLSTWVLLRKGGRRCGRFGP